jgi:hypothetical protein
MQQDLCLEKIRSDSMGMGNFIMTALMRRTDSLASYTSPSPRAQPAITNHQATNKKIKLLHNSM